MTFEAGSVSLITGSIQTYDGGRYSIWDLAPGLLLMGAILLACSLYYVHKLTTELPQGINRNWWYYLGSMILLFKCGYLGFFYLNYGKRYTHSETLVAIVFYLGSIFVLLVTRLACSTTQGLKRIYVLEQETITDPMLKTFNRRYLDRRLQEEVQRAHRHGLDLSLLMVDIDHFKQVNDTWGHQIGDLVLQHLAQLMLAVMRQTDIVARFGGEEFLILLPHTSEPEANQLAERLRRTVEYTPLLMGSGSDGIPELHVTVSIGGASAQHNDDAFSLLERCDQAMYRAKQEGRNRVVQCSSYYRAARIDDDGNRIT